MGTAGRYSIVLFRDGGEGSGIEAVLDSDDLVETACGLYQRAIMKLPGRLVMLSLAERSCEYAAAIGTCTAVNNSSAATQLAYSVVAHDGA